MSILHSIQNLDEELLLLIQQYLRSDILTPVMKMITFLGNGGWFWILCAVILLVSPKTRKVGCAASLSIIFGALVTNVLLKAFCSDRCPDSADRKTDRFFFPVRTYDSIFCSCVGDSADVSEEIRCSGSDPGCTCGFFQTVSGGSLSYGCSCRIPGGTGGQYVVCVVGKEKRSLCTLTRYSIDTWKLNGVQ